MRLVAKGLDCLKPPDPFVDGVLPWPSVCRHMGQWRQGYLYQLLSLLILVARGVVRLAVSIPLVSDLLCRYRPGAHRVLERRRTKQLRQDSVSSGYRLANF